MIELDIELDEIDELAVVAPKDCPVFQYEVLQDNSEFLRHLDFMFESRMLCIKSSRAHG